MFETTKEFLLKSKIRKAEKQVLKNTLKRKDMLRTHNADVRNLEKLKEEIKEFN